MIANKLQPGDELRIISPSRSLSMIAVEHRDLARQRLEQLGFTVSFGGHCLESDEFVSSPVHSRLEDLHQAFADPQVTGILTTIGGYNCNQLLRHIDYSLIAAHPKRLCGYSDITALSNAIYAKTGLITYSGPHFSTFGMLRGNEYTLDYFQKMMMQDGAIRVEPSRNWSDDLWFLNQENRCFMLNEGPYVINAGAAEGTIIGGNLGTFNLLQGTEYMPSLKNSILFLEDTLEATPNIFDRNLQSLIHQPAFKEVKGLVFGRFQQGSGISRTLLRKMIKSKMELDRIPVIADADFGHTSPMFTFPVGGHAVLDADGINIHLLMSESSGWQMGIKGI